MLLDGRSPILNSWAYLPTPTKDEKKVETMAEVCSG